jgi:DNA (cytosine-5)-methyltransferase 1
VVRRDAILWAQQHRQEQETEEKALPLVPIGGAAMNTQGLIIDLFAGGGGASLGIEAAMGRPIDVAINHDPIALAVHAANHPHTLHIATDIWAVKPHDVAKGRPVALLWASPDCTHFSVAKGGKPRKQNIRSLAWTVVRWAHDVRPDVICLENVAEFRSWGPLDETGKPRNKEMGDTFRKWKRSLEKLGYVVDYRILRASDYGTPTSRKRLFLVARRDGLPIRWPLPTHGGMGLLPVRTAAECIDWSLPCPSIFGRKKPLADKTLWRIAQGIKRFVLSNPRPFIVKVNHGGMEARHESLDAPVSTVTATSRGHALVAPTLIQTSYGEREGQRPRYLDLHQPLGTVVAGGTKHALVAAFLAKHYSGVVGVPFDGRPLDTVTAADHHSLSVACLAKFRGTDPVQLGSGSVEEPLPTISAGGIHSAEVRAFLTAYYSGTGDAGQDVTDPTRTITTKDRLGLVTVEGVDYCITDIGMRMLEPHELLRAQFGMFAARYDLSAAKTKTDQVRLIGNSVAPEVAEAVVRANLPPLRLQEAAE